MACILTLISPLAWPRRCASRCAIRHFCLPHFTLLACVSPLLSCGRPYASAMSSCSSVWALVPRMCESLLTLTRVSVDFAAVLKELN